MTKASDNVFPRFLISEGGSTSTPASGNVTVYAKANGLLYSKDDAGTETALGGGASALTAPTFVAAGSSATGTGDITPGLPAGHTTDDILLLFVQTSNQTAAAPAGYVKVGPAAGFGTAAAAASTRLTVFWKRDGGAESDPTVTDPGDHAIGQIIGIRGCPTTGDPFVCVGATRKTTASTTGTASAGATPVDNCLVINAFAHGLDSASAVFSSFTNADLSSVTERIDVATTDGTGGGIGVSTGLKAVAGSFAATTVTETSTTDVSLTFIMLPAGINHRAGFIDRQVFLTPGLADTWTRPTGAKTVIVQAIGGGGSGSAGRNAATAAGGGGGGGGGYGEKTLNAGQLGATATITAGAGGAATANTDGTVGNNGNGSSFTPASPAVVAVYGPPGFGGAASASGSGGVGGQGGGNGSASGAGVTTYTVQGPGGGTGGTTAMAGGDARGLAGGSGAGGGTSQATSKGGDGAHGAGGGGGGRSNTNVGTGGGNYGVAGGATAGAVGADSPYPEFGGAGAAGGTSAAGPGGAGGWPGGGGGGGGSQSGAQRGGAGGDGVVTVTTFC